MPKLRSQCLKWGWQDYTPSSLGKEKEWHLTQKSGELRFGKSHIEKKRKWYWRQQIWTKKEKIYTHDKKDTKHILTQGISVSWFDLRDETWRIGVTRSQGGLPSLFLSWDWMHYKYLYEDSKAEHAQISRDSALAHARCCISKSRAAHSPRCVIKWRQVITISKAKFEKWK